MTPFSCTDNQSSRTQFHCIIICDAEMRKSARQNYYLLFIEFLVARPFRNEVGKRLFTMKSVEESKRGKTFSSLVVLSYHQKIIIIYNIMSL